MSKIKTKDSFMELWKQKNKKKTHICRYPYQELDEPKIKTTTATSERKLKEHVRWILEYNASF
jgi:hypothetical protein